MTPDTRPSDTGMAQLIAAHEQTLEELGKVQDRLTSELIPLVSGITATINPALIPWRHVIAEQVDRSLRHLGELDELLRWLRRSGPLPVRLWLTASEWVSVRATVSGVAGELSVTNREVHVRWQGVAADTYAAVVPAHTEAATRLATVADTLQFALNWAAAAIAQMYAAVLGLVVAFIGAALIALATAATVVGAVAALVGFLLLAGTVLTAVSSVIVASVQAVGTARTWLSEAASELADQAAFPGGRWPTARPEWFLDATTADGDPSDWTVR